MKFIFGKKVSLLALTVGILLSMPQVSHATEEKWLSAITNEMLTLQVKGWGDFQPYLAQIQVARIALRKENNAAAYVAIKRFTDMLENRENSIAAPIADWLFEYCYKVMPVNFREAVRNLGPRSM